MAKARRRQAQRAAKAQTTEVAATDQATATPPPPPAVPRPTADPRAAERIQRQRERAAARRRYEMQRRIRTALIAFGVVVLVGAGIFFLIQSNANTAAARPGETVAIVSPFSHVPEGTTVTNYNTTPPTSGQHYARTADAGVHTEPIPNEVQVHNLEHGQIMIQYTCDCPEIAAQLKEFADQYGKWVIVAPYPNEEVGAPIVLTAWGAIMKLDQVDREQITNFIEFYKNKGPEKVFMD